MEFYIGQILLFAGTFAPRGWAYCHGQLLSIQQNSALFSILGTTYGGNGTTNFGLPDLRGRVPMGTGQGPGLTPRSLGEIGGTESVTLTLQHLPAHQHQAFGTAEPASSISPGAGLWATPTEGEERRRAYGAGPLVAMNGQAIGMTGAGMPHTNVQPYLGLNYIICTAGIFPQRP